MELAFFLFVWRARSSSSMGCAHQTHSTNDFDLSVIRNTIIITIKHRYTHTLTHSLPMYTKHCRHRTFMYFDGRQMKLTQVAKQSIHDFRVKFAEQCSQTIVYCHIHNRFQRRIDLHNIFSNFFFALRTFSPLFVVFGFLFGFTGIYWFTDYYLLLWIFSVYRIVRQTLCRVCLGVVEVQSIHSKPVEETKTDEKKMEQKKSKENDSIVH